MTVHERQLLFTPAGVMGFVFDFVEELTYLIKNREGDLLPFRVHFLILSVLPPDHNSNEKCVIFENLQLSCVRRD